MPDSLVEQVLWQHFPEECDFIGPTNVTDICEGDVEFERPKEGQLFDISAAIELLNGAATFINTVICIYIAVKSELGQSPTKSEMISRLPKQNQDKSSFPDAKKEEIIEDIISRDPN